MILKGINLGPKPRTKKGYQGSNNPFYKSKHWIADRANHLAHFPLCKLCQELEGRTTLATVSDHIIPINQGGSVWDWSNRQALCKHHNAVKTALDNGNNNP